MQLPFTVVFEPPQIPSVRRLARRWRTREILGLAAGAGAAGLAVWSTRDGPAPPAQDAAGATLRVDSAPRGASVEVDGAPRGRTPTELAVAPGERRVTLRREHYADATARLRLDAGQTADLTAELWLRVPSVQRLRPTFPGATIADARFGPDGVVALTVALPPAGERQLWLLDERAGARRFGPPLARGSIALSADGGQVAYVAGAAVTAGRGGREDEVWTTRHDGDRGERRYALPADAGDERLHDLSWAPDGRHLLIASQQQLPGGGQRTRLRWLDTADGGVRDLVSLPSAVVPASHSWSPGGDRLALLTQAGQLTSLCLVGADGAFRYLADVGREGSRPLPFPPLAWSADGRRLLYAAPAPNRAPARGWRFGSPRTRPSSELFALEGAQPAGRALGDAPGESPAWRSDGSVVALARSKGSAHLLLRAAEPGGGGRDVGEVPIRPGSAYAARWDVARGQAIVAVAGTGTTGAHQPEFWLVRFRPEVGP